MKTIIIVLILLIPIKSIASDFDLVCKEINWTKTNTILESAFFAVTFIDVYTTDIRLNHTYKDYNTHRVGEKNPLFGTELPSSKRLWTCFGAVMIGHIGIGIILPNPYRKYYQIASILIESIVIYDNHRRCGLKFSRSF